MVILQDSREQKPLTFDSDYITDIRVVKLDVGDYGCEFRDGFVPPVFFERKALGDLFSTFGVGHKRFKREIERAKDLQLELIILIEGTLERILNGKFGSIEGITIVRKLFTFNTRYSVPFVCCKSRNEAAFYVNEYYCSIGRTLLKQYKQGQGASASPRKGKR